MNKITKMMKNGLTQTFMERLLCAVLPPLLLSLSVAANNIQVSNMSLTGENFANKYVLVQFDLDWENSWRTSSAPNNWDAAWVFVKYRITTDNGGDDLWKHAWLNNTGHSAGTGTGATIDVGLLTPGIDFHTTNNPGLGVFIYRAADGEGDFSVTDAQLRWNYGANGVADHAKVDVKVFAIEMVYVPEGVFYVGSGGNENGRFKDGTTNNAFQITSEGSIEIGNEDGKLWGSSTSGSSTIGGAGTLPAGFPKGFAAFYCMKYPITQQQYVDFLNTLSYTQQNNRIDGSPNDVAGTFTNNEYRHKIKIATPGEYPGTPAIYETEHPYVANNFINWMDGVAYFDWAGLRPMTELEYEKASRGTATPVANEYAWGTTGLTQVIGINNSGAANETASNSGNGLSVHGNHGSVQGPLRVGALATSSTTTRASSGASYYGIIELSGNLWERTVTVGNTDGRAYTGLHGDGALSADGHANETDWPGLISGEVTGAKGSGVRGGDWLSNSWLMRASDRAGAAYPVNNRYQNGGFRGVRTQPFVCGHQIADIDGNYYNTVQIGNQCWMKENLKTTHYSNGTPIEYPANSIEWRDNTTGAYGWYNNDTGWKDKYGALYNWHAVNNANGLCPTGWRVPTHAEYEAMANHLGGAAIAGGKMKSTRTAPDPHPRWRSTNTGATNESGWSGLPGGERIQYGGFSLIGDYGFWWSSTESSDTDAWNRTLYYNSPNVGRTPNVNKGKGLSVRCLRE